MKISFWGRTALLAVFCLLYLPALALAAVKGVGFAPSIQTWALILGAITPLFTYVLNHVGPWLSEKTKAVVLLVVAGVVGAVYTAIESSTFGWNDSTVQLILTAILGAFGAHALVWKPSGINTALGGGRNAGQR
jgi:uncharacterized membrane protein YeaQ/YmgE (transglycosylase-associated protein family)